MALAVLEPGGDLATVLYIVSFSMFIFGVRRGTHPTTAKQGNLIGTIAIVFGTINIVGGFMVTDRMLGMFARKPRPAADTEEKPKP